MNHLIIGGGIAGTTAAEEIRKKDKEASITLVSEEFHPLYSRVLLPHYLKGKIPRERVFLKKESWYAEQNIDWMVGITALKLDAKNRFVALSNGRELPYDKLLIASGMDVRPLFGNLPGVMYLRTLEDADEILEQTNPTSLPPTSHLPALVYGGGFIACEFINYFTNIGWPVRVAHRGSQFWEKFLLPEAGALIRTHLEANGVEVLPHMPEPEVAGKDRLESVSFNGKAMPCRALGVGIGLRPDWQWALENGVKVDRGVVVNEFLETDVEDIFAAGDIVQFQDIVTRRSIQVGNWMNAIMQGRVAAANMLGEKKPFRLVSSYATDLLGMTIIFIGDTEKAAADKVEIEAKPLENGLIQRHFRNGVLVGAVLMNQNKERAILTKQIDTARP
ncbi:FAD-dependent oxidoreductase [Candidatus Uhrbacteria bacterium]|nr:FAD-dependent oxidoreductase [Candidatus Uhrbacteria bacterium]